MKQNHLGISVKLWKLVYTALSSGRVLMFYLLHIFSWKRKEKKKKYTQFWMKAWTENRWTSRPVENNNTARFKLKHVFILLSYVQMCARTKELNTKHLSVVSSVRSTFITRMKLTWCQRRGGVSLHSIVTGQKQKPGNSDIQKNTSVLLKSARESRAYSTEERYCTDATVSHVIDSWISLLTLSEHTVSP